MSAQHQPHIYLASESPRRRQLLGQIGVAFEPVRQDVQELPDPGESPEVFVIRLALDKARAGLAGRPGESRLPVLGADTIVVVDDRVLGKPADEAEFLGFMEELSGRAHRVLTGVALVDGEREATRLSVSNVTLRDVEPAERRAYWRSGEPADKAGGYAIQGRGAVFVESLEGSYSGVMGLPLFETADLLAEFDIDYQSCW